MRTGLEKSRNLMTVRLAQSVDMEKVIKKHLKISTLWIIHLVIYLLHWCSESTLFRMTNAYS